jgi:hypothetical protein
VIKHVKKLWGHYFALILLSISLFFPISWVYHFFQVSFGNEAALVSLTITIMTVMVFGIRGAIHTHRIIKVLQQGIPAAGRHGIIISLVVRIFKIGNVRSNVLAAKTEARPVETDPVPQQFMAFSGKRRGKRSRFPEEKIRRAVLRWESRDPSFSTATLEEFLAQEFGSGPDGILLMAPTTFYDWRRRILQEARSCSAERPRNPQETHRSQNLPDQKKE